eukprot:TRINITY_DN216_c0_g1_i2.p1 TRINITY_DN216_c0_g1~~TRINITY_DN216_c0_g1_i2.p1  ORF type:complete len:618 (-),score=124.11 TRINITY_DN216_c0_g1_i2:48-1847(-)
MEKPYSQNDKDKLYKVFQLFDNDNSGDIDVKEFQELAFESGVILTDEQAKEAVKNVDKDQDGKIQFNEFYDWWRSASSNKSSLDPRGLDLLKIKLRSQKYLRTVSRAMDKAQQHFGSNEHLANINFILKVGAFKETKSGLKLEFVNGESLYKDLSYEFEQTGPVLSIGFVVNNDADNEALNEINNALTPIVEAIMPSISVGKSSKFKVVNEDGRRVFRGCLEFINHPLVDLVETLIPLEKFLFAIDLDQSPEEVSNDLIRGRIELDIDIAKQVLENPAVSEIAAEISKPLKSALEMATKFNRLKFELDVGDLGERTLELLKLPKDTPISNVRSWSSLKFFATQLLSAATDTQQIPQEALDLYFGVRSQLESLKDIKIVAPHKSFVLSFNNFTVDGLLPSQIDMGIDLPENEPTHEGFKLLKLQLDKFDGGQVESQSEGYYLAERVVQNNFRVYCTTKEKNANLLLKYDQSVLITHIIVKTPPSIYTAPLKSGLVWITDTEPTFASIEKFNDTNSYDVSKSSSPNDPVLFFEFSTSKENYGEFKLSKPRKGKYVLVKLLRSHFPNRNIDVEFIGAVAYTGGDNVPEVSDIGPKLNVSKFL